MSKEFYSSIEEKIKGLGFKIVSKDQDRTVCTTLKMIADKYGNKYELAFANGGDQNNETIPEREICNTTGINLIDGLGDKIQSSSWLLEKTKNI